jgi:hypothetical protein
MRCQCVGANVSPMGWMLSPPTVLIKPVWLSYRWNGCAIQKKGDPCEPPLSSTGCGFVSLTALSSLTRRGEDTFRCRAGRVALKERRLSAHQTRCIRLRTTATKSPDIWAERGREARKRASRESPLGGRPRLSRKGFRPGPIRGESSKIGNLSIKTIREGSEKALPLGRWSRARGTGALPPPLPAPRPICSTPPVLRRTLPASDGMRGTLAGYRSSPSR